MSSVKPHGGGTPDQLKCKVPRSAKFFIFWWCVCVWGGLLQTNSNAKCQGLPKFSFSGGWGLTSDRLKSRVPRSAQIFILGGGGVLQTNIPEILEWGTQGILNQKILPTGMCSASQIVSYILPIWRLIKIVANIFLCLRMKCKIYAPFLFIGN